MYRDDPFLVYWMKVDEVLDYDLYFHDLKFQKKRPQKTGSWISRCGDNIYFIDREKNWSQAIIFHHQDKELI